MGENQMDLIELLIQHEEAVMELYEMYADRYQDQYEFWNSIMLEEAGHVNVLRIIEHKVAAGKITLDHARLNTKILKNSIEYLKKAVVNAESGREPLIKALTTALDIEKGMIESRFFETLKGDEEELKNALNKLQADTRAHMEKIRAEWEKYRHKI